MKQMDFIVPELLAHRCIRTPPRWKRLPVKPTPTYRTPNDIRIDDVLIERDDDQAGASLARPAKNVNINAIALFIGSSGVVMGQGARPSFKA